MDINRLQSYEQRSQSTKESFCYNYLIMANKLAISFSFFILLLLLPLLFHPASSAHTKKPSPFDFLQNLQGIRKGDKAKDIIKLKKYLQNYGYLSSHTNNSLNNAHDDDDHFNEQLVSAIKTYQLNFNLKPTGILDSRTVSKMMMPRCGVPDIINGSSWMRSGRTKNHPHTVTRGSKHIHFVSHYAFFSGYPRWPVNKYNLTYAFLPWTPSAAMPPVAKAFQSWSANSHFTFTKIQDYRYADLTISFQRRDHGDGAPFDGRYGILAHAMPPTYGIFHLDGDELWAAGVIPGYVNLESVARHEIGHLLGLMHSSVPSAIMYPVIPDGTFKGLHQDDIQGLRVLYNR